MTVKELYKEFRKLKRKYGDLDVRVPGDGTIEAIRLFVDENDSLSNQWIEVFGPAMNQLNKESRGER